MDWLNQEWNRAEWNDCGHYFWQFATGYGETYQRRKKRKGERRKAFRGWPNTLNPPISREDPVGEEYAASNWALKTNEMSIAKQMPSLGEFPSYSEWGEEARRCDKTLYNHPLSSVIDFLW